MALQKEKKRPGFRKVLFGGIIAMVLILFVFFISKDKSVLKLPFEMTDNKLYIKASINNGGAMRFLFDTGGGGILLDSIAAEKAGVPSAGRIATQAGGMGGQQDASYITRQQLDLSKKVSLKNAEFTIMSLEELNASSNIHIAGIIGFELMNRYVTKIDFDKQRLVLYKDIADVDIKGYTAIPFQFYEGLNVPRFPVSLTLMNGETVSGKAIFDSGAGNALAVFASFENFHNLRSKLGETASSQGQGLGSMVHEEQATIKSISFAGFKLGSITIDVGVDDKAGKSGEFMGLLGFEIIKRFDVIMDYGHKKIYLKFRKQD